MTAIRIGRAALIGAFALSLLALSAPAQAQTGAIKGKVVDEANKPVRDVVVTIQSKETNRKYETRTNSNGDYRQVGLSPGNYIVSAQKDKLAAVSEIRIGLDTTDVNLTLSAATGGDPKKEAARIEGIKTAFAEGATLTNAGKYDEAIAKFNEVLKDVPKCYECYVNIGAIHSRQQQWDQAEAAYKKAIEVKPDSADAYNGLANIYNAQKKFKEAQAMNAEALKYGAAGAAGGDADGLYNQGVIAWNANDFQKAQELFAAAVKANDKHAEAHFMLGQAYLNLGKLGEAAKEFETYTKIAPSGPNAEKAKTYYEQLKQYIK